MGLLDGKVAVITGAGSGMAKASTEIFVRELVSNASDALEKLRHLQLTEKEIYDDRLELFVGGTLLMGLDRARARPRQTRWPWADARGKWHARRAACGRTRDAWPARKMLCGPR